MHDLDVLALDLCVVVEAELDDVHPELRVLDTVQCLDDIVFRDHGRTVAEGSRGVWHLQVPDPGAALWPGRLGNTPVAPRGTGTCGASPRGGRAAGSCLELDHDPLQA